MNLEMTITDQEGGIFFNFVNTMIKCVDNVDAHMDIDFGWIGRNCDGSINSELTVSKKKGSPLQCTLLKIKIERVNGSYHYKIDGADQGTAAQNTTDKKTSGDTKMNKMDLDKAIKDLCENQDPKFKVDFWRLKADGTTENFKFAGATNLAPPKGGWRSNNNNKIKTIYSWIAGYVTDKGKGIFITSDCLDKNHLILWENSVPGCDIDMGSPGCSRTIGYFVVNGGNCSSVLDFNPTMDWVSTWSKTTQGGAASGGVSAESVEIHNKKEGGDLPLGNDLCDPEDFKAKSKGVMGSIMLEDHHIINYGGNAIKKINKASNANRIANMQFTMNAGVQADLKIQGTVEEGYTDIVGAMSAMVAIAVINPMFVNDSLSSVGCPTWLAQPVYNEMLSHKQWNVQSITHNISGGKFTTTLNVKLLDVPGVSKGIPGSFGGDNGPQISC